MGKGGSEKKLCCPLFLKQDSVEIVNAKRVLLSRQIFVFQSWYFLSVGQLTVLNRVPVFHTMECSE